MESLTRPFFHHRRKPSTASCSNGLSFSGKDEYGDLLSGNNKKTMFRRGVVVEDYGEIFGGGLGGGRGSSIPVLDLSDLDRPNASGELQSSNSHLDFSKIFGGLAGGDDGAAAPAVPPYEELFGGPHKSKCDQAKHRATADTRSPMKSTDNLKDSDYGRGCLSAASRQMFDSAKQLNMSYHKTSQLGKDGSNGTTPIAQLNAVPGFTCFVDGDSRLQKQDRDKVNPPIKTETNDKRSTSDELSDRKSGRRAKWKLQNGQASEGILNGKGDTDRNLSELNRRLFHSGEMGVNSLKIPPPSISLIDRSHPKGKLFYSGELDLKSWPSKVPPSSSSLAQLNDNKVHLNQSKSFAFGSKVDSPEKDAGGNLTPSDEELDVDSAAAVSAAALKKAIQQAQESIRLAKELTERKQDPIKAHSRSALKVNDARGTQHDPHITSVWENNMKDACEVVDAKALVSLELNENILRGNVEVISVVKDINALSVNRKTEVQTQEETAEAVEGGGMSLWFTQFLNNGKNRMMAAFASQLVDNKNNAILPEKNKQIQDAEMTKPEKNNSEKVEAVARVLDPKDAQGELSTFDWTTGADQNVDVCDSDLFVKEDSISTRVDEATRKIHNKFEEEGEESEKKLEEYPEMMDDKAVKSRKGDRDHSGRNFIKLVKSEDEAEVLFKLKKEEILDAVCGFEENESIAGAVDTGMNLEGFCLVGDDEGQPKAAAGNESIDKKTEDVAEIRSKCYSSDETDEQMQMHFHDGLADQILSKEEYLSEGLDQRTDNHQYEATDWGHGDADDRIIETQEIDVTEELKENDSAEGEMDECKESIQNGAWSAYANENHFDSCVNSRENDDINMPSEILELCRIKKNIFNEQISGLECRNSLNDNILAGHEEEACHLEGRNSEGNGYVESEEDNEVEQEGEEAFRSMQSEICETSYLNQSNEEGDILETIGRKNEENNDLWCEKDEKQVEQAVETSCLYRSNEEGDVLETIGRKNEADDDLECEADEKEVQEAVEDAIRLKQNGINKKSCLDQSNVQGDVLETIVQDVSEAFPCDDKMDNFGFASTIHEETMQEGELPTNLDLLTTAFIHIGTEGHGFENDRENDNPLPEKSPPGAGFLDMNVRGRHEDPNFVVVPENTSGLAHECDARAENIVEDDNNATEKEVEKDNNVEDHRESDWVEKHVESKDCEMSSNYVGCQEHLETDSGMETVQSMECSEESLNRAERESIETKKAVQKETGKNDYVKKIEVIKREREHQKDRIAVEKAIREARERAFTEARERAELSAVEKANAEVRERAAAGAQEKLGKVTSRTKVSTKKAEKASSEAKFKAERAAVERATAEARERALEKALSEKANGEARAPGGKVGGGKSPSVSTNTRIKHSLSSPDLERCDETNNESAQRRKARLERHQRVMERASKALAEKNMRDILAQREQAERNRLAETLDAEIKRWAIGKEGNLRALLSTLQYILGANSGWRPITLTEIITSSAVKKAYRKATLYVHPDKLQQRGASIQQKYICEKVFDLLKAAWNKFNSEEG